jgi:hypothetical protein
MYNLQFDIQLQFTSNLNMKGSWNPTRKWQKLFWNDVNNFHRRFGMLGRWKSYDMEWDCVQFDVMAFD